MCSFCLAALKRRPPQPPNNHQETFCTEAEAEAGDEQRKTHKQTHLLRTLSTHHGFLSLRFGCVSGWLGACQAYPLSKQWEHGAGVGGRNRNVTNKPIKQVLSMKTVRFGKKKNQIPHPLQKVELRNYQRVDKLQAAKSRE